MFPAAVTLITAALTFAATAYATDPVTHNVEVVLEKSAGSSWEPADPRTVFKPKDEIRFRFQSTFDGYLYVLNKTASGQYLWLFPSAQSGSDNRISAAKPITIPSTEGAFVIPDNPGFDTVYWILSPTEMRDLSMSPLAPGEKSTLMPRCNDSELRARGNCLDDTAGPRSFKPQPTLPKPITSTLRARELKLERKPEAAHIKFAGMSGKALIYEFWIAHR